MINFNSMCSNGNLIWGIDNKGVIYEIDISKTIIRLVHWIEGIDDENNHKFPVMCYYNGTIIIAPSKGQRFWMYDPEKREITGLSKESPDSFVNYYESKDSIFFIGREGNRIAVYDKKNRSIEINEILDVNNTHISDYETRGGCVLDSAENRIVSFTYGSSVIYEIDIRNGIRVENKIDLKKSIAFAHIFADSILIVTTDGRFWKKKENDLTELVMPSEAIKCENAPFHYWTKLPDGLVFMPCAMNMVLKYTNDNLEVEKVCSTSVEMNSSGHRGIFPCCAYDKNKMFGMSRYEDCFYEIDVNKKDLKRIEFTMDYDAVGISGFVKEMANEGRILAEGEFGISLEGFLQSLI